MHAAGASCTRQADVARYWSGLLDTKVAPFWSAAGQAHLPALPNMLCLRGASCTFQCLSLQRCCPLLKARTAPACWLPDMWFQQRLRLSPQHPASFSTAHAQPAGKSMLAPW